MFCITDKTDRDIVHIEFRREIDVPHILFSQRWEIYPDARKIDVPTGSHLPLGKDFTGESPGLDLQHSKVNFPIVYEHNVPDGDIVVETVIVGRHR